MVGAASNSRGRQAARGPAAAMRCWTSWHRCARGRARRSPRQRRCRPPAPPNRSHHSATVKSDPVGGEPLVELGEQLVVGVDHVGRGHGRSTFRSQQLRAPRASGDSRSTYHRSTGRAWYCSCSTARTAVVHTPGDPLRHAHPTPRRHDHRTASAGQGLGSFRASRAPARTRQRNTPPARSQHGGHCERFRRRRRHRTSRGRPPRRGRRRPPPPATDARLWSGTARRAATRPRVQGPSPRGPRGHNRR